MPWAVLLAALAYCVLDAAVWHPGFCRVDEAADLARLQACREGSSLPWQLFQGSGFKHMELALASLPAPKLFVLRLPALCAFAGTAALVWTVAARLAGGAAAGWSLMVFALASTAWVHSRSLLAFSVGGFELMALAALAPMVRNRWHGAVWGVAAGLLAFEYEGWVLMSPVLAVFGIALLKKGTRRYALAGVAAAVALATAVDPAGVHAIFFNRIRYSASTQHGRDGWTIVLGNMRAFWLGGETAMNVGVYGHPLFPPWAWPGLAVGLWLMLKEQGERWLPLAALFCLLPLPLASQGFAANRYIAALPVLALVAGTGFARLSRRKWVVVLLGIWGVAGAAVEVFAHQRAWDRQYQGLYGGSASLMRCVDWLGRPGQPPFRVLENLDPMDGACFRLLRKDATSGLGGPTLALVPVRLAPAFGQGGMDVVCGGGGPALVRPPAAMLPAMDKANDDLGRLARVPQFWNWPSRPGLLWPCLERPGCGNAWSRTVLWEAFLMASLDHGGVSEDAWLDLERDGLLSGEGLRDCAFRLARRQPERARRLYLRACAIDRRLGPDPGVLADMAFFEREASHSLGASR